MDERYNTFIRNLVDINDKEVQQYTSELEADRKFQEQFGKNRRTSGGRRFSSWGVGPSLGTMLYVICRKLRPETVVETGVASGISSSYILCALETNGSGGLHSIDLPWGRTGESGWLIPEYLRHRWQLLEGRSSEKLPPLLEKLGEIDIFFHDSDHSYRNMLREFETAWARLKTGGLLLSHNIDYNDAFSDFCRSTGVKGVSLGSTGGAIKPAVL